MRDLLLGREPKDFDVATSARPEVVLRIFPRTFAVGAHFGVVLDMDQFDVLAARLKVAGIAFVIEPHIRFKGEVGEQATMFFLDPSGNALEFKAFKDRAMLFAK